MPRHLPQLRDIPLNVLRCAVMVIHDCQDAPIDRLVDLAYADVDAEDGVDEGEEEVVEQIAER